MRGHNDWLYFAEGDLVAAKLCLQDNRAYGVIFYHCQQCAEKALKAYIVYRNEPVTRTHDLVYLRELCEQFDSEFTMLSKDTHVLNPFSQKTRYPENNYSLPDVNYAKQCIEKAYRIL
jgi:HEPN domain-containing protein